MGQTMRKRQGKKGKRARQRQRNSRRLIEVGLDRESVCERKRPWWACVSLVYSQSQPF